MSQYNYKITKTYNYYGPPQAEYRFTIEGEYFTGTVRYYGNQGFSYPEISHRYNNNGYFWSLHLFMKKFYNDELRKDFFDLREGESKTITIES